MFVWAKHMYHVLAYIHICILANQNKHKICILCANFLVLLERREVRESLVVAIE